MDKMKQYILHERHSSFYSMSSSHPMNMEYTYWNNSEL